MKKLCLFAIGLVGLVGIAQANPAGPPGGAPIINSNVYQKGAVMNIDTATVRMVILTSATINGTTFYFNLSSAPSAGQAIVTDGASPIQTLKFGTAAGGGGGASSLGVYQSGVSISTPTSALNYLGPPFTVTLQGSSTAQITLNSSSVTLQGQNVIFLQNTLQSGAVFNTSSGTVVNFNASTVSVNAEFDETNASTITFTGFSTMTFQNGTYLDMSTAVLVLPNGGGLVTTDCNADSQRGRIFISTNATTGKQIYVCEGTSGWVLQGGSSSTPPLGVYQSGVIVSTPTGALNFLGPPFKVTLQGSTSAQIALDASSATLQGQNVIFLQDSLQPGATFWTAKGTSNDLHASTLTVTSEADFTASTSIAITGFSTMTFGNATLLDLSTGIFQAPWGPTTIAADCSTESQRGRVFVATTSPSGHQFYVCEGGSGWQQQGSTTSVIVSSIAIGTVYLGQMNAAGNPDVTRYLRGDFTWAILPAFGGSSLAVTTGTSSGFGVPVSSPTSALVFDSATFKDLFTGLATSFVTLNPSSVTLQGTTVSSVAVNAINVGQMNFSGTPSATTFARGDGTWATPAGGGGGGGTTVVLATGTSSGYGAVTSTSITGGVFDQNYFTGSLTGGSTEFFSIKPAAFVLSTETLQSGTTFYTSSGTVAGQFQITSATTTGFGSVTTFKTINLTGNRLSQPNNNIVYGTNYTSPFIVDEKTQNNDASKYFEKLWGFDSLGSPQIIFQTNNQILFDQNNGYTVIPSTSVSYGGTITADNPTFEVLQSSVITGKAIFAVGTDGGTSIGNATQRFMVYPSSMYFNVNGIVNNSTFTVPSGSTISIAGIILDGNGSAGTTNYVLTSQGSGQKALWKAQMGTGTGAGDNMGNEVATTSMTMTNFGIFNIGTSSSGFNANGDLIVQSTATTGPLTVTEGTNGGQQTPFQVNVTGTGAHTLISASQAASQTPTVALSNSSVVTTNGSANTLQIQVAGGTLIGENNSNTLLQNWNIAGSTINIKTGSGLGTPSSVQTALTFNADRSVNVTGNINFSSSTTMQSSTTVLGAIEDVNGSTGTIGQVLSPQGGAGPTWVNQTASVGGTVNSTDSVRVYNSTGPVIPVSSTFTFKFDSENYNYNALHSTTSNTTRLTAKIAGTYNIFGTVLVSTLNTSAGIPGPEADIVYNGSTIIARESLSLPKITGVTLDNSQTLNPFTQYFLNANDYVELVIKNLDPTTALTVVRSADVSPVFGMALNGGGGGSSSSSSGVTGSTAAVGMGYDGNGSAIVAGSTRVITVPYGCTLSSWSITADASGSMNVTISSATFLSYQTSGASALANIVGSGNTPSLSTNISTGAAVSGWTKTSIEQGSVLGFVLNSASTVKWANIVLWVIKT